MSRIPKSAMKHAQSHDGESQQQQGQASQGHDQGQMNQDEGQGGRWSQMSQQMTDGATRLAERARGNPAKAFALGAGVIGAAAAAVPLFRWGREAASTLGNNASGSKAASGKAAGAKARSTSTAQKKINATRAKKSS
jgi:hypothetical protein